MTLDQAAAERILEAALKKARAIKSPSSVAVVDAGRNLLAFVRMDGALLASIEISIGKAYTSRSLNMKTSDVSGVAQPGAPLYGLEVTHRQPLVIFGGGVPLSVDDEIVGAVGVAGGTVDQDEEVALAGAAAIER
ncbi:MAG: GlcG/HbpS family heme-binding protein [Candidatus Dormibacteraceae bacterium]